MKKEWVVRIGKANQVAKNSTVQDHLSKCYTTIQRWALQYQKFCYIIDRHFLKCPRGGDEKFFFVFYRLTDLRNEKLFTQVQPTFKLFAAFGSSHEDKASYAFYLFNGLGMIFNFSVNNLNAPNRPHPSPPPQQSRAVQNCGTIKVNWRFYIPLCFSLPPRYPLPQNWI
jgi:hypothetical protein